MSRLKPAMSLDEYEDRVSGFGAREDREARRAERRKRRRERKRDRRERKDERKGGRKERKGERRLERVARKKEKVREKLATAEPTLVAAPSAPGAPAKPKKKLIEHVTDLVDDFLEEDEEVDPDAELEEDLPEEGEATEGVGWQLPLRVPVQPEVWGPAVRMGNWLKIQAAQGFRAAVIELKPGLFLVAEMPEAVTRTEFGLAPLLAPLMTAAARRSLDEPQRPQLFRNLFRRRDAPIRYVTVQPPAALPAAPAPAQLPGPVAEPQPMVVAAPNVGWADDATVAAAYGCDCEKEPR